jgi:hypothetical protein
LLDPLPDLFHTEPVCLGIALGRFEIEALNELTIDERVLCGDFGGRSSRHLASDAARLQKRDR